MGVGRSKPSYTKGHRSALGTGVEGGEGLEKWGGACWGHQGVATMPTLAPGGLL